MKHSPTVSRWTLFFIIFYLAVPQIALDLYLPSIPSMVHALHATASQVQLTIAMYLIAIAVSQFFYGPLSDSFGRKPMLIIGGSIFVIGSILCVSAQSIHLLLWGRLVQGMGFGCGASLSRAILRDVIHDKKTIAKVVSMQSMAWSSVPLIAPLFGGYIEHWFHWRVNFMVLLALGVLMLLITLIKYKETRLPETRNPFHPIKLLKTYQFFLRQRKLVGYILIIALQYGAIMTVLQMAPFIFQTELGYSAYIYGWLILVVGMGSLIGAFANKTISQYFDLQKIILYSLIVAVAMTILMNGLAIKWFNAWVIIVPIFVLRIAGGFTYSNCIAEGLAEVPEHSGSISALYGIVISSGAPIITAIVAHFPQYKQWTLTSSVFVEMSLALGVFLIIFFWRKKEA